MAGSYLDPPSWRMAYDRDGTQVFHGALNALATMDPNTVRALNSEQQTGMNNDDANRWTVFIFPEHRDLDAVFVGVGGGGGFSTLQASTDTTNGVDGTWVTVNINLIRYPTPTNYRQDTTGTTILGVKALRLQGAYGGAYTGVLHNVHLYGEPVPGENMKRLDIWHPTLDQRVGPAHFDWGNVPRASSAERSFRVKNLHDTLTAQDVRVAIEALTAANPSMPGQHFVSVDGTQWLAQVNIGDLGPGAISPLVTLRRVAATNAQLSLWTSRLFAEPLGWA